ncbi:MAG: FkbM family methyltransferase, partial [Maioricimonas sp. JB049]
MEQRLELARWLAATLRYRTLPLAEWVFATDASSSTGTASVRLFGYDCPLEVSRSVTHRLLCVEGERFVQERFLLAGLLQKGDVVVDVGANIGYMGLLFQKCIGPEGRLIGIEPDPDNFRELKSCVAANGLENVVLVEAAVGHEETLVTLEPGLNGHIRDGAGRTVPQMTLDSLDSQRVDFI